MVRMLGHGAQDTLHMTCRVRQTLAASLAPPLRAMDGRHASMSICALRITHVGGGVPLHARAYSVRRVCP